MSLGSQTGDKEAQETLMDYFAQKRLGRCRMTCLSCGSVLQQSLQSKQVVISVQSKCSYI